MRLILPFNTVWEKEPSLMGALDLVNKESQIVSIVGAGGKTSTIERLAYEYKKLGKKVVVTTTTHMYKPENKPWCQEESMEVVDRYLKTEDVLWIGLPCGDKKIKAPKLEFLTGLKLNGASMIIEADGAKRLPFKVPGVEEPVILSGSHMVIGVLGMDALGKPINEVCFRPCLVADYLGKSEDSIITKEDYVKVILSETGLKKSVTYEMEYVIILNKVDDVIKEKQGYLIREMLLKEGQKKVLLTSYRD